MFGIGVVVFMWFTMSIQRQLTKDIKDTRDLAIKTSKNLEAALRETAVGFKAINTVIQNWSGNENGK